MRKFKIGTDPEKLEPTAEQIARRKDFPRLSHKYDKLVKRSRKPLYRDPKVFLLLMLLGIIALLLFLEEHEQRKPSSKPSRELSR